MKKYFGTILASLAIIFGLVLLSRPAMASVQCPDGTMQAKNYVSDLSLCNTEAKSASEAKADVKSRANKIINWIIGIVGLLAVIMIIVSGFQMTVSGGNSAKVAKAKNTLIYSVVGLVIALLAYAIVNFVLKKVFNI